MTTFEVRPAIVADIDALVAFNRAMAQESEAKSLDVKTLANGIANLMRHPADGYYLVADAPAAGVHAGGIIGALMVTFEWSDWRNGRFWWIQSVYVRPDWRRKGVYRALHAHVRALAKHDPEACGLRLYVERENTGAQSTYRSLGMVETHYRLMEEEFSRER